MAGSFSGKVVLVAGGTGGLGRAVSLAFLNELATVVVTYRREQELNALKAAAGKYSSALNGHLTDVADQNSVHRLIEKVLGAHGRLDVLINTVGGYSAGSPLWQTDLKVFKQMLTVNLYSGYALAHEVVPFMLKQGSGAIVNVASRAAVDHGAGAAAYAASKAAAVAMMDSLAADLKGTGVRANSILPGIIDTEANRKAMPDSDFSKWPKPEEIARVIVFLAGDEAKLIHGASVPV